VSRVEKVGGARTPGDNYGLEIFCKDNRNLRFALTKSDRQPRKDVFECLTLHAFPVSNGGQLFAFKFKQQVFNSPARDVRKAVVWVAPDLTFSGYCQLLQKNFSFIPILVLGFNADLKFNTIPVPLEILIQTVFYSVRRQRYRTRT